MKHGLRTATVVSETDCSLLVLEADDFELLLRDVPELSEHLHQAMAARLSELERGDVHA